MTRHKCFWRWFSPVGWARVCKGEEAHLGWMMTRLLCASLWNSWQGQTLLADMRSWKQALGGGGWNSDFREGSMMENVQCTDGQRAGQQLRWSFPPLRSRTPLMLILRCAILFYLYCFSFWLLFWIKLACLCLSISVMGVGCYTKGGVSIYRGKNPNQPWRLPELSLLGDSPLQTLGSITTFSVAISWVFQILNKTSMKQS